MTHSELIGLFLKTRRNKLQPVDAGLPMVGRRHVPGLRRAEVAQQAGISTDYYAQLEQGKFGEISVDVLAAVARALQLTDVETQYLFDLAHPRLSLTQETVQVPSTIALLLDSLDQVPAVVHDLVFNVVATNRLGSELYMCGDQHQQEEITNLAEFVFLAPAARKFFCTWEDVANFVVGALRFNTRQHQKQCSNFIAKLIEQSPDFAQKWQRHNVTFHSRGSKQIDHPQWGRIDLLYEVLPIAGNDLFITMYFPDPEHAEARGR